MEKKTIELKTSDAIATGNNAQDFWALQNEHFERRDQIQSRVRQQTFRRGGSEQQLAFESKTAEQAVAIMSVSTICESASNCGSTNCQSRAHSGNERRTVVRLNQPQYRTRRFVHGTNA
jgi:hypothetical protein